MSINLYSYQIDAIKKMKNGCILNGGVGTGKSRTSLGYYYILNGGSLMGLNNSKTLYMKKRPCDLYIITTARKRDTFEWEIDMAPYLLSSDKDKNYYDNNVVVDSWNNITKYTDVKDAFFIFDEQRIVGSGAWVKAFYKIAAKNQWILLSATPGDTWTDYIPVFVANGFYKNKSQFLREHAIYSRYSKFPKIEKFYNTGKLLKIRNDILIDMEYKRETIPHHIDKYVEYDSLSYKLIFKERWNAEKNEPIVNAAELCYELRKNVNSHPDRVTTVLDIFKEKKRVIIFYNFDYELEILKTMHYKDIYADAVMAEWNGHKHQPLPKTDKWLYLVQYTSGCEGWNATSTDTIIFYSQNYSYKVMAQAAGRIDRLNTKYVDLYYYHIKSRSGIDLAIAKALKDKKKFNETRYMSQI